ncbi:hypothetical protein VARIO8X_160035 [Burkholderiales bacterium 8X]|nr:hypothetical protein VARIO8X_160035 [Burkholderiales bacterium 8X]
MEEKNSKPYEQDSTVVGLDDEQYMDDSGRDAGLSQGLARYDDQLERIRAFLHDGGIAADVVQAFIEYVSRWSHPRLDRTYITLIRKRLVELRSSKNQTYATLMWRGSESLQGWIKKHDLVVLLSEIALAFIAANLPAMAGSFYMMSAQIADRHRCKKSLDRIERMLEAHADWAVPTELHEIIENIAERRKCAGHGVLAKLKTMSEGGTSSLELEPFRHALSIQLAEAERLYAALSFRERLAVDILFVKTQVLQLDQHGNYVWHGFVPKRICRKTLDDGKSIHDMLIHIARAGLPELALAMGAHLVPAIRQYEEMEESEGPGVVLDAMHSILKEMKMPDPVSGQLLAFLEANIRSTKEQGSDTAKKRVKDLKATASSSSTTTTTSTVAPAKPET